jgi:hypothetical protein
MSTFRRIKDANGNPVKCVDYPSYFKNLVPEKYPAPGEKSKFGTNRIISVNKSILCDYTNAISRYIFWVFKKKKNGTYNGY